MPLARESLLCQYTVHVCLMLFICLHFDLHSFSPPADPAHGARYSSAVEYWTRNPESSCSNPLSYRLKARTFSLSPRRPGSFSGINEYLVIGNAREHSSRVIAASLECFPKKPSWCRKKQVCQGRGAKSVNLFGRSNRLDTALYTNYLYIFCNDRPKFSDALPTSFTNL